MNGWPWGVIVFSILAAVAIGTIALWLQERMRKPRLGQKITSKEERRIKSLFVVQVEMEIRELLKQAIDLGADISTLPALHTLLQNVYWHPERYQRFPDVKDAAIRGRPLPYEGPC